MSTFTPTGGSLGGGSTTGATNPQIIYLDLTLKDTEYSFTIPSGIRLIKITGQGAVGAKIKLTFTSGESGTTYIPIWPGSHWQSPLMEADAVSEIYLQSTKDAETAVFELWK